MTLRIIVVWIVKHGNLVDVQTTWNYIQEDSKHSCK